MSEQFDAESALVGCLLLEPDKCADEIFTQLEDNVFANQYAKECFKACKLHPRFFDFVPLGVRKCAALNVGKRYRAEM